MPSYFPEGNTPQAGESEQRSLQKVVSLLGGGGGGGGSTSGSEATWQIETRTITDTVLGVRLASANNTFARRVVIFAPSTNVGNALIGPNDANELIPIPPGGSYVIEMPSGRPDYFDLYDWYVNGTLNDIVYPLRVL